MAFQLTSDEALFVDGALGKGVDVEFLGVGWCALQVGIQFGVEEEDGHHQVLAREALQVGELALQGVHAFVIGEQKK